MKRTKLFWILLALCVINLAAHLVLYPSLPEVIPTHWGITGAVDGWGAKWMDLVLAALPFGMLLLFYALPAVDPKAKNYEKFSTLYTAFTAATTAFMIGLSWLTVLAVFGILPENGHLAVTIIEGGCGVLFLFLGNYMPKIKQNYFMGVKTPWALADEHTWQRSQRMGGIVFVIGGFCMVVDGVLGGRLFMVPIIVLVFGVIWLYVYSYLVFVGKMK